MHRLPVVVGLHGQPAASGASVTSARAASAVRISLALARICTNGTQRSAVVPVGVRGSCGAGGGVPRISLRRAT